MSRKNPGQENKNIYLNYQVIEKNMRIDIMNHRQELKTLLKTLNKTPTRVLDKNILIPLKTSDFGR